MNHHDLVSQIAGATGVSKTHTDKVLKQLGDTIANQLAAAGQIHLHGIGTLNVVETAARKGRNPATGDEIDIPAGKRIKLKAAKVLKTRLSDSPSP